MRLRTAATSTLMFCTVTLLALSAGLAYPGVRVLDPDEMLAVRGGRLATCYKIQNEPCDTADPTPCGANACDLTWVEGSWWSATCPSFIVEERQNAATRPACVDITGPANAGKENCNTDPDTATRTKCVVYYQCEKCLNLSPGVWQCQGPFGLIGYRYTWRREYVDGPDCPAPPP